MVGWAESSTQDKLLLKIGLLLSLLFSSKQKFTKPKNSVLMLRNHGIVTSVIIFFIPYPTTQIMKLYLWNSWIGHNLRIKELSNSVKGKNYCIVLQSSWRIDDLELFIQFTKNVGGSRGSGGNEIILIEI